MEASPMSLFEKFIKEAYGSQYVIPVYQRNYTWRKNKQVKQLLADIERNGNDGIGHPEPLRGNFSSYWSRTIDEKTD